MIYTVTPNPCIDLYMNIENIRLGEVNRSVKESLQPGGKGINVSRALLAMGHDSKALGILGESGAQMFYSLLSGLGIEHEFVPDPVGSVRINVKLSSSGRVSEFNSSGRHIDDDILDTLCEKLNRVNVGDIVIISGSSPKYDKGSVYGVLVRRAKEHGAYVIADTSGDELLTACKCGADLVKPNVHELNELFGFGCDIEGIKKGAGSLLRLGAASVLVSCGGNGAFLFSSAGAYRAAVPDSVPDPNTVGSGDCSVAGVADAILKHRSAEDILHHAVAAGTCRACGNDFFDVELYKKYLSMTKVCRL